MIITSSQPIMIIVWINAHKITHIQIDHRRIVSRMTITSFPIKSYYLLCSTSNEFARLPVSVSIIIASFPAKLGEPDIVGGIPPAPDKCSEGGATALVAMACAPHVMEVIACHKEYLQRVMWMILDSTTRLQRVEL